MELPAYEGGTGGKFRRRPVRRPSPYDRPPSAARGLRGLGTAVESRSGWLSKLVDPASRFITGSASRIFSSVFRKGPKGLPEAEGPEQNCQVRPFVPQPVDVPQSESQVQEAVDGHNPMNFETQGISEIEKLLRQNKYTKDQVDYLTGLICSRAIEPTGQESENYNEKISVSDKGFGVWNSSLNRNLSASESPLNIPQDVAASPAEIAKAYMSSRLPKASTSTTGLQSQGFREHRSLPFSGPSATKPHGLPLMPRSVLPFSEPHEFSGAGYPTPKPRGRSDIYRMSRSPYFKIDPAVNAVVGKYTTVGNASTSSVATPGSTSKSDGRQVLKRVSSILDSEYGSFGPIRRVRQKSALVSAANARLTPSSSSRSFPLLQLDKEELKEPYSSRQPCSPNELKYVSSGLQINENRDSKIFSPNVPPVPGHSTETSRKILEQLDKFTPPEKKSNIKPMAMDESPSKLTTDMLNGRALRSMENVDTSQFTGIDVIDTSDIRNAKDPKNVRGSQSEKLGKVQETSSSNLDVLGVKFSMDAKPSIRSADITNVIPATMLSRRKPAFQMTAPEDFLEVDDEQDADVSVQSTLNMVKTEPKTTETEASISGMSIPGQTSPSPSKSITVSSSVPFTEIGKTNNVSGDSKEESSFRFPVATNSSGLSLPSQSLDKLLPRSEQMVPAFMFGSRSSGTDISSSITDVVNDCFVESKPDQRTQFESSNLFSRGKDEAGLHKSSGTVPFSGLSTSGSAETIAFGASITSTQSNGSVCSSSLSSLSAASTADTISRPPVSLFSSNSNLVVTSSSSPISSASPALSSPITYNFGAASTAAPVSVSSLSDKSNSVDTEGKLSVKSPFRSFTTPTTQVASSFLSAGSSDTSLVGSTLPGSGGTTSVEAMPSSSMSMAAYSTSLMPYTFSGASSSGSGFAPTSFSAKSIGVFGLGSSSQTDSISVSAANSSSQNSSANFGAAGGSLFAAQPAQSGSNNSHLSQSLTSQPDSFSSSSTLGPSSSSFPVFGTSSSSAFGLNSSSSPGSGQVLFGASNQGAKPFGSTSDFSFNAAPSTRSSTGLSFSTGAGASNTSSAFFSSVGSASNSSTGFSFQTGSNTINSGFSFSASASSSSPTGNNISPVATSGLFGGSSLGPSSSISSSLFGSSPSTGLSFGLKSTASGVPSFGFGSSSVPAFSFTSSSATMSASPATPVFEMRSTSGGFSSVSQNNDQMSVEDTMADDTNQAPASTVTFGQPNNNPYSNFVFGSAVPSSGTNPFQFNSQQNPPTLQNPNPFQTGGNSEFAPGGSFSLGSGGGDKSSRKIVKVRRDKIRRK
ncbi:nuclear pore complex protein NUP1-like [Phalaenopsis equestris]|uniref:nuclear pore complex protein NUP1-like n=1 Tax=Phalaenopsis equestris TaxID=78828 RepID=UPI0009E1D118|nr:nuclear pore complex protein NUP1-like [Phalaenopsis equestris]